MKARKHMSDELKNSSCPPVSDYMSEKQYLVPHTGTYTGVGQGRREQKYENRLLFISLSKVDRIYIIGVKNTR